MKVLVYHHDFPANPDALTLVAEVQVGAHTRERTALEFAFRRTQNIDGSWSHGPEYEDRRENPDHHPAVTRLAPLPEIEGRRYGLRSSMMGDVFEIDGRRFRCAAMGFERIA
jgi:hypothetical protein